MTWWGVVGFLLIEGTMLTLCFVTYFYLRDRVTDWPPPTPLPDLLIPIINLFVMLTSVVPVYFVDQSAKRLDVRHRASRSCSITGGSSCLCTGPSQKNCFVR